ncbi:MAG: B12-binding domain-containing radical SAM protein [Methanolinea sp.]
MKILFVNPPVIRFGSDNPESDPRIRAILFRLKLYSRRYPILYNQFDHFGIGRGARFGVRAGSRWPWTLDQPHGGPPYPFIMGYAASLLKSNNYDVNLIDAVVDEEYSYDRFLKKVRNENADIVVLECSTPTIDIDLWMAKEIALFSKVALAGPHLTTQDLNIQEKHKYISFLLKGEYIYSALKMAETQTLGIYESEVVTDLDSIPFPFRDYTSATQYYEPTMPTERPQLQIYGSKGCPFRCSFCLWPQAMYKGKVALRKPEKIAEEIQFFIEKFGYKSILFDDDTFNLGNERVSQICDELKKIGLPWTMMGRLDCSPDWLFDKMVNSGCVGMRFGIESFDLNVLKNINKGLERIDFKNTLKSLSDNYPELMIHLTMMKNLPGQSDEIHKKDMNILYEMGFSGHNVYRSYQLSSCAPFPGTKLHEVLSKDKDVILQDYSKYDGYQETIMKEIKKR